MILLHTWGNHNNRFSVDYETLYREGIEEEEKKCNCKNGTRAWLLIIFYWELYIIINTWWIFDREREILLEREI